MERSYLQTIGTPVVSSHGETLGRVSDIILNTDTGKAVGFLVGATGNRVVVPIDILEWNHALFVHDAEDVIDTSEVVQVENAINKNMSIVRKKVVTKSGEYIGKVVDFGIEDTFYTLTALMVAKVTLGFILTNRCIISAKDIIEVKEKEVIVKDLVKPIKMKKLRINMASQSPV